MFQEFEVEQDAVVGIAVIGIVAFALIVLSFIYKL